MKKTITILFALAMILTLVLAISSCRLQGDQGARGEKGDTGASIEKVEFDEQGRLVITLTDGSVLDPVALPEKEECAHDFSEWYAVTAPTCTRIGLTLRYCRSCQYTQTASINPSGHTYTSVVTPPTCTEQGYTTHVCTACGTTVKDSYTAILPCEEYAECPHIPHYEKMTYVAFGDSITYGIDGTKDKWGPMPEPYPSLVGDILGIGTVQNKAISGATLCADSGQTNMTEKILSFNGHADIISVMLGVNDYQTNRPLGNADSRDNSTVYGSLFMIAEHLTANYSDALVFFITPFPTVRAGGNGATGAYHVADVAEAVKYVAAMYGIPVLDLHTMGKYELEMVLPTNDGIHPSQEHFRTYTAPQIADFIKACSETDPSDQKITFDYPTNRKTGYATNAGQIITPTKHFYCEISAEGLKQIIIVPPTAGEYNPYNLHYVVYVAEDGSVTYYAPLNKSTPTVIDLGEDAKGTVYFNAFTDELNYIYVKEAILIYD